MVKLSGKSGCFFGEINKNKNPENMYDQG